MSSEQFFLNLDIIDSIWICVKITDKFFCNNINIFSYYRFAIYHIFEITYFSENYYWTKNGLDQKIIINNTKYAQLPTTSISAII